VGIGVRLGDGRGYADDVSCCFLRDMGLVRVALSNFQTLQPPTSSRQVAQAAPGRPAFRMHPRLEYFIAVVEVQFLLDMVEVEARARKSDLAATSKL
jgi:hypothetical protein